MTTGIVYGLGAALFQSIAYLSSRHFTDRKGGSPVQLLLATHILLGPAALAVLLLVPKELYPPLGSYLVAALGTTLCFMMAQILIFAALRRAAPSRVSPLLGLKILFVVVLSGIFFAASYTGLQFAAVFLALGAALVLNYSGGSLPGRALILILTAALLLAGSDIFIQAAVLPFAHFGSFMQGVIPLAVSYAMAGILSLILWPFLCSLKPGQFADALPFTFSWTIGIILFFISIAEVGVMYTAVLQSLRGLFNVLFGAVLGYLGFHLLEEKHNLGVILRRIAAALMMTGAITLFGFGGL